MLAQLPADAPFSEFLVTGGSMLFLLRSGDVALIERASACDLRWGDLVVVLDKKRFVIHRIVWKRRDGGGWTLFTKGDALMRLDTPLPESCLIGRVNAVRRADGRVLRLDTLGGTMLSLAWALFSQGWFALGLPDDKRLEQLKNDALRRLNAAVAVVRWWTIWSRDRALDGLKCGRDRALDGLKCGRDRILQAAAWGRWACVYAVHRAADTFVEWKRLAREAAHAAVWAAIARWRLARDRVRAPLGRVARILLATAARWAGALERWARERGVSGRPLCAVAAALGRLCDETSFPVERRLRAFYPRQTLWGGEIALAGDVLVPRGSVLRVRAGVRVRAERAGEDLGISRNAFGTRLSLTGGGRARLLVYGTLVVEPDARFEGAAWGGIVVLGGGRVAARGAQLAGGGLVLVDRAAARLEDCLFEACGLSAGGLSFARLSGCRFVGAPHAAVRVADGARLVLRRCETSAGRFGLSLEGCARALAGRLRAAGLYETAAAAGGLSRLSLRRCEIARSARGVFAGARARVLIDRCRVEDARVAAEAVGDSRLVLSAGAIDSCEIAVWAQNRARAEVYGALLTGNFIGVRAGHRALARVRGGELRGHSRAALFCEDRAALDARGTRLEANDSGAIAIHDSWLRLFSSRLAQSADTGIWADYRACVELRSIELCANRLDRHREYRPTY